MLGDLRCMHVDVEPAGAGLPRHRARRPQAAAADNATEFEGEESMGTDQICTPELRLLPAQYVGSRLRAS